MAEFSEFLFRGLMFEAEAEKFRNAGLRVGADSSDSERSLLNDVLLPFDIATRNAALQMSRIYAMMYCFENAVRELITKRLTEKHGANWWSTKVPASVKSKAESRKTEAKDNSWLEGQKDDILGFMDFGELATLIIHNWADFEDLIPTQHWLKQRMDELEKARNFIAHNRVLLPTEFQRIEMYVADWNRQVGL